MSGTNTMTAAQAAAQAQAQNAANRQAMKQNSIFMREMLPTITQVQSGQKAYSLPLRSQGLLVSVDVLVSLTVNNAGANPATPQVGAPFNLIDNLGFTDQSGIERSNMSGLGWFEYLSAISPNGASPFDSAPVLAAGGADFPTYNVITNPVIAAGASGTVKFVMHVTVSRDAIDTTGIVPLAGNSGAADAQIKLRLAETMSGIGAAYDNAVTITGGTLQIRQNYFYGIAPFNLPSIDTTTVNYLIETGPDSASLIQGMTREIKQSVLHPTDLFGMLYFNGASFESGTDIESMENWLGNLMTNNSTPAMRFEDYVKKHNAFARPGRYWEDYRGVGGISSQTGLYTVRFVPSKVTADAYVRYMYRQARPASTFAGAQIG